MLSLFWRKFNTAGIVAGLIIGTVAAVALVPVSPNMQYPKIIAAGAQKISVALEKKQAEGAVFTDAQKAELAKAKMTYESNKDGTSLVGLDKPWFPLRTPASFRFRSVSSPLSSSPFYSGARKRKTHLMNSMLNKTPALA